jgi:hypothetical protein
LRVGGFPGAQLRSLSVSFGWQADNAVVLEKRKAPDLIETVRHFGHLPSMRTSALRLALGSISDESFEALLE